MAPTCAICQVDTAAQVFVLPCHQDHLICKDCLHTTRVVNGHATKCPVCQKIFGWLDEALLEVYGGEDDVNALQCCALCMGEGRSAQSSYFCVVCDDKLCSNCHESHERYFRGTKKHKVITFNEFRTCADKYRPYLCDQNEHSNSEISFACTKCSSMGCSLCIDESTDCNDGGTHQLGSLIKEVDKAKKRMRELKSYAFVESLNLDGTLKTDTVTMEDHRVAVEKLVSQSSKAIEEARAKLDDLERLNSSLLKTYLGTQGRRFDEDKKMKLETGFHLKDIQDGITAILESSHHVKLVQTERELRHQLEVEIKESRHQSFTVSDPELKTVGITADNLVGLEVVLPTFSTVLQPQPDLKLPFQDKQSLQLPIAEQVPPIKSNGSSSPEAEPLLCSEPDPVLGLLQTGTTPLEPTHPSNANHYQRTPVGVKLMEHISTAPHHCYTVTFHGKKIIHGGSHYNSVGLDTGNSIVSCIRSYGDSVILLRRDVNILREAHVMEFQTNVVQKVRKKKNPKRGTKNDFLTKVAAIHVNTDDGQIAKLNDGFVIKTSMKKRLISIYAYDSSYSSGSSTLVSQTSHPDFKSPRNICLAGEDVYITDECANTIFVFSIRQPAEIRKLDITIFRPLAITIFNGYLVVLGDSKKLHILTLQGVELRVIDLPESTGLGDDACDLSVSDDSVVAVANGIGGIKLYEFTFE